MQINELKLAKDLIRKQSITPKDAGAINLLAKNLISIGFNCKINKKNPNGPNLYCAVIVKKVDEKTRSKTSINDLLRD